MDVVRLCPFYGLPENGQLAPLNCASRTRRDLTGQANYNKKTSLHLGDSLQLAAGIFNSDLHRCQGTLKKHW
jgi:hypothetical protein